MTTRAWGIAMMVAAAVGGAALFYALAVARPTSPWSGAVAGASSALLVWGLVLVVSERYRKRMALFAAFVTLWGIALAVWVARVLSD
jgi:hypothetical protein